MRARGCARTRACARFLTWLGPEAGPQALTLATMAAYQAHLAAPVSRPETLCCQLGHASMKTTQIYFASDEAHEDSEVLAFDRSPLPLAADGARRPA